LSFFVLAGSASAASVPTISDNTWAGQTLVATPVNGADSIEWYQCGPADTYFVCPDTGQAGPDSPTLVVGDTYYVVETGSAFSLVSSQTTQVTQSQPGNSAPPTIAGDAQVGDPLTVVTEGAWGPQSPGGYAYQWVDCVAGATPGPGCTSIAGATQSSYTLVANDEGDDVEVAETPLYDGTSTFAPAYSDAGDTVAAAPPSPTPPTPPAPHTSGLGAPGSTTAPSVTGVTQLGQSLTAKAGSWTNDPTSYDYQWERCAAQCADISGATTATYQLALADVGDPITVKVTAVNATGSATATSSRTSEVTAPSTVQIVASPTSPLVNQPVTLVGIVSSGAQGTDPSGTVAFDEGGQPIPGCADVTVPASGQTVTVSCMTSFPVSSPVLSASFSPAASSPLLGSASATTGISILRGYSTTSLDVSGETERGASTTFTASIAAAMDLIGPVIPTGTVTFLDHGKAIAGCGAAPIKDAGATCTVRYTRTGSHSVTARYDGGADFRGSVSRARTVRVTVPPSKHSKILGRITATMQWTFHYTPSYTRIVDLDLYGAHPGSTVTIDCSGRGCPFKGHSRTVDKPKRCRSTRKHTCPATGTIDLEPSFRRRDLRAHAKVTVTVTRGRYIGKYYRFTIRPRKQPLVDISCLASGSSRPGVGCTRHRTVA
jgi:hypothetical protein